MPQASTLDELRRMSDEDLIRAHDEVAAHTMVGINYYLEELARRRADRTATWVERLTWAIAGLTLVLVIIAAIDAWLRLRGR